MCTIYGLICKHAKKIFGKKVLNVTTVKLFSNKKKQRFMGFFDVFLFQPLIKGKYLPILWFVTFYCFDMAPKIHKNSKSTFQKNLTCIFLSLRANSKNPICHD